VGRGRLLVNEKSVTSLALELEDESLDHARCAEALSQAFSKVFKYEDVSKHYNSISFESAGSDWRN
jgi:hypothetical protein